MCGLLADIHAQGGGAEAQAGKQTVQPGLRHWPARPVVHGHPAVPVRAAHYLNLQAPQYCIRIYYINISHNFINLGNISNTLRYLYGRTHM